VHATPAAGSPATLKASSTAAMKAAAHASMHAAAVLRECGNGGTGKQNCDR
jgi:hypothetical protein